MMADEIIAVLDAGPLIHLDEIESLRLLAGYREVLLPDVVEREARSHRPEIQIDSIPGLVRVSPDAFASESMFELAAEFGLHAGELERFRAELAEGTAKARRAAMDLPPPATVRAYQTVYGRDPKGWPPA